MKTPLQQARELHEELKKDGSNVEALLRLTEFMREYDGDDRIIHSSELDAKIQALENEERYYTGIKKLDGILGGLRSNQIIVLSAPPKAGKTQLCVQMARNLPNPTMFLFEESPEEVLYKYKKKGIKLPSFYTVNDLVEDDVEGLYRKMIEAWAKYNSRIFFVDHLHYLLNYEDKNTAGDKIRHVMTELKKFTKRHNFTIILVAHMTKGNFTEPPGIEAIRDSSFIPQFADTTIILWRETIKAGAREHGNVYQQTNNLLINVALNRKLNFETDVNTGLVDLTFNTATWEYEQTDWYTEWILDEDQQDTHKSNILKKIQT
jgi:predicted ATP-dependent serine protease